MPPIVIKRNQLTIAIGSRINLGVSKQSKQASRTYKSPLREAQAEATRERVIDAAIHLLGQDPTAFTMPAVARAAGVSQPTVYRLFPDKEALAEAARDAVRRLAGVDATPCRSSADLIARQNNSLQRMSDQPPEVMAALASLNANRLSEENLRERADHIGLALEKELKGVPKRTRERVARILMMLYSSTGATMLWRFHLLNDEGAQTFAWLCETLIAAAQREGKR